MFFFCPKYLRLEFSQIFLPSPIHFDTHFITASVSPYTSVLAIDHSSSVPIHWVTQNVPCISSSSRFGCNSPASGNNHPGELRVGRDSHGRWYTVRAIDRLHCLQPLKTSLAEIIFALSFLKTATKGSMRMLLVCLNYHGTKMDEEEAANGIDGDDKETSEVGFLSLR